MAYMIRRIYKTYLYIHTQSHPQKKAHIQTHTNNTLLNSLYFLRWAVFYQNPKSLGIALMKIDTNRAHSQWQTKYAHFIFHFFSFHLHFIFIFQLFQLFQLSVVIHPHLPVLTPSSAFLPFLRGFKSDEGYLCWSLPISEFVELLKRKAFHVLQSCTNAILSTLETLGKDPSEPIDTETRNLLQVLKNKPTAMSISYFLVI